MSTVSSSTHCVGTILSFEVELAIIIGVNEAIFLHRLDQLLATALCIHENGRKWICKTVEDWQREEFPFTCYQSRREKFVRSHKGIHH